MLLEQLTPFKRFSFSLQNATHMESHTPLSFTGWHTHRTVPAGDSEQYQHPRSSQSQKHCPKPLQDNGPHSFDTHISLPTFETDTNETVILVSGSLYPTADTFFAHSFSFFILSTI